MAFDYGSIDLGIRNPFKLEGAIRAAGGAIIAAAGLLALLSVQGTIAGGAREVGTATAVVGLVLTAWGLWMAGGGLFQVFRFFVGRSVPASLAPNKEKSQQARAELGFAYTEQQLEQMLQGRQNISFEEPEDWFSRLVHSVFRRLLYLPYGYRNLAQRLSRAMTQSIIALASYGLAWFSGTTGITNVTLTPVMDWLALILTGYLVWVWLKASPPLARLLNEGAGHMPGATKLTLWIGAAIGLPVALAWVHGSVVELPAVPVSPGGYVALVLALGVGSVVMLGALISARSRTSNPVVEVAEYRDNWQETIHPQELFIHFETIVMANRRYKEVPNRLYRGFDAALFEQGSDDKGEFSGEMIQETQPVFHTIPTVQAFSTLRIVGTTLGTLLLVASALLLYRLPGPVFSGNTDLVVGAMSTVPYLAILGIFGRLLSNCTHAFWAEMQFESLMVYFQSRGTYTESKLSTGTSIYDSTRSENVVVRSSMTLWMIAARVVSSTFATSGSANLERKRYVLELHKSEQELQEVVSELRGYIERRETIASLHNEKDLAAASRIHQVNQRTRAQIGTDHPPVDQERIADHTGDRKDGG